MEDFMGMNVFLTFISLLTMPGQTHFLAVSASNNTVQLLDVEGSCPIQILRGHTGCICSLGWNFQLLSFGSQDTMICQLMTFVTSTLLPDKLKGHGYRCGLEWNIDGMRIMFTFGMWQHCSDATLFVLRMILYSLGTQLLSTRPPSTHWHGVPFIATNLQQVVALQIIIPIEWHLGLN